eukprot:CAMPEP_0115868728 /NCGR_PEP_ID=MMETSP0287-20121206/21443_1 /TAXON_ID=412157 /ORGANISM="Chrysochromulina rotalis, Strain UIO044" /LENGTH=140 /DNA_ID=CAMNT_0003323393 /DNA_START=404 /DNA_END=827 /DNA_ORIENTATION=-
MQEHSSDVQAEAPAPTYRGSSLRSWGSILSLETQPLRLAAACVESQGLPTPPDDLRVTSFAPLARSYLSGTECCAVTSAPYPRGLPTLGIAAGNRKRAVSVYLGLAGSGCANCHVDITMPFFMFLFFASCSFDDCVIENL